MNGLNSWDGNKAAVIFVGFLFSFCVLISNDNGVFGQLPNFTGQCVQGADSCATFKSCCEDQRCEPGIYLLFRCAKKAGKFNPDLSYCKCSATRPTQPSPEAGPYPNYTETCLNQPGIVNCKDFEQCCSQKTCEAGVERRYECGYYNHNLEIQRSKALCLCQSPLMDAAPATVPMLRKSWVFAVSFAVLLLSGGPFGSLNFSMN